MSDEDIEKLKEWYKEQLEIRDKQIEELKKENLILLKTSLKQANRREDLMKANEKLQNIVEKKKISAKKQ